MLLAGVGDEREAEVGQLAAGGVAVGATGHAHRVGRHLTATAARSSASLREGWTLAAAAKAPGNSRATRPTCSSGVELGRLGVHGAVGVVGLVEGEQEQAAVSLLGAHALDEGLDEGAVGVVGGLHPGGREADGKDLGGHRIRETAAHPGVEVHPAAGVAPREVGRHVEEPGGSTPCQAASRGHRRRPRAPLNGRRPDPAAVERTTLPARSPVRHHLRRARTRPSRSLGGPRCADASPRLRDAATGSIFRPDGSRLCAPEETLDGLTTVPSDDRP